MDTWLAQHFVHSAFVPWGAALVASPILIHLINRLRFRRVRFAAMDFLLQSQQRNRRRVLLEQLLLLLLRILIVLAIVTLIARLILDPLQLSLFHGAKSHHVVVLDDSGSMRDRWGQQTAFDKGLDVIRKLIAEGARRPGTQRFSLVLLSNPDQPFFSQRDVNDLFLAELDTKLDHLPCTHRSVDLVAGIHAAGQLLVQEKGTIKHLHLISDFRQRDWKEQDAITGSFRTSIQDGVTLNLVRTASNPHQNLAVTQLTGAVQVAARDVPLRLKVVVRNFGDQVAKNVRLLVLQDGQKLPLSIQFDKIEVGVEVYREFDLSFDTSGKHQVQVELPGDALIEDNSAYLALSIAPVNEILIVEGRLGSDDGAYLADALAADPRVTGYAPKIESVDYLRKRPLDKFQSIFLLNVPELPPDALAPLEHFVAAGGGLSWFLGDVVHPEFYNSVLCQDSKRLFPVPLANAPRETSRFDRTDPGPDMILADHPIFRVFSGQENPYIEATRVYKFFPVAADWHRDDQLREDDVTTIAWLRNQQPLIFEHRFGKGNVITCLTSCGPSWNNWALYASYVVLQLEIQKQIARRDRTLPQRIVGEPIHESLDPSEFTDLVEITTPELAGKRVVRLKAGLQTAGRVPRASSPHSPLSQSRSNRSASPAGPLRLIADYTDTDTPGVYQVKTVRHTQVPEEDWIAFNFPGEESELTVMSPRQLRSRLGAEIPCHIQEADDFTWIGGKDAGQEIREWLIILLVLCLLGEQLLASHMSYRTTTLKSPIPSPLFPHSVSDQTEDHRVSSQSLER